jgi:hypothetical protein
LVSIDRFWFPPSQTTSNILKKHINQPGDAFEDTFLDGVRDYQILNQVVDPRLFSIGMTNRFYRT